MRQTQRVRILTVLILGNLGLIWGASLMNGTDSGSLSGGVLEALGRIFPFLLTDAGHYLLRKAAHFSEFCLLGILTGARRMESGKNLTSGTALWGMGIACIDETIQTFVPGRVGSPVDVCIDSAGYLTGLILCGLGYKHIRTHKNHQL